MDKDFSELIEYLDKKFKETAKREEVNEKFNKLLDVFVTKDEFKEAIENLPIKEDFNNLLTSVDAYAKKADTYFQEMVMLSHQVRQHEKWIFQLAEKLGIKLEY